MTIVKLNLKKGRRPCKRTTSKIAPGASTELVWSFYQNMSWLKTPQKEFFVRSGEQNYCPCCGGKLKVQGSRKRKYIKDTGKRVTLVIRRLQCKPCKKIHHELPDILVPYKHYSSESIEAVITGETKLAVAADESTINRWRKWFWELYHYFLGCLASIAARWGKPAEEESSLPESPLQRIWQHVGDAPLWLGRVVHSVVNANLWVHTQFAFLSG